MFTPEQCAEFAVRAERLGQETRRVSRLLTESMMALYGEITEGAEVRYHFTDRHGIIVERPGVIVKVWDQAQKGLCNLVVFVDGSNDLGNLAGQAPVYWATSVPYSTEGEHHTWHFPPG